MIHWCQKQKIMPGGKQVPNDNFTRELNNQGESQNKINNSEKIESNTNCVELLNSKMQLPRGFLDLIVSINLGTGKRHHENSK